VRKGILMAFLAVVLAIIVFTWGSIASAALTLGLLLAGIYLALNKFRETHDPDDLFWNE